MDDEVLRTWREKLRSLRAAVDKTWATERPTDGGNLRLIERFADAPDALTPIERERVKKLMEISPQLERDVAEIRRHKKTGA
jgi:hypothetical protein